MELLQQEPDTNFNENLHPQFESNFDWLKIKDKELFSTTDHSFCHLEKGIV
jgi:hypothetical protein